MKRILFLAFLLAISIVPSAQAETPSDDDIMKMVQLSGTMELLTPLMNQMSNNVISSTQKAVPNLPVAAFAAIDEEFRASMNLMVQDILTTQMLYYQKHLTAKEVHELIAIYSSPTWEKAVAVNTQYVQNEMQPMLEQIIPKYTSNVMQRIMTRLKKDGYLEEPGGGA